jgi:hypothetical protein
MLRARRAPWVKYHNIVGVVHKSNWFGGEAVLSDGVVEVESAHMDDVASEIMVEAKHQDIHTKPRAILEVRSILVEHLREVCTQPALAGILELPNHWYDRNLEERNTAKQRIAATSIFPTEVHEPLVDPQEPIQTAALFAPLPFPPKPASKLRLPPIYSIKR